MSLSYTSIVRPVVKTDISRRVGGDLKQQMLPASQAGGSIFLPTVRQLSSTYPSNIFASAGTTSSLIPKIDYVHHIMLKVVQTISGAPTTLTPCQYWFRQMQLRDSTSGAVIQNAYDDSNMVTVLARCDNARQRALFKSGVNMESDDIGKYGLAKPLPVGTHTFFIPVLTSVFENFGGLFLSDLQGDLALDLTTPATIIASGAGSVSTAISFIVEGSMLSENDAKIYRNRYKMHVAECQFLTPIRTEFLSFPLTASSNNNMLSLRNVDGLCAFQQIMVRPTGQYGLNGNFAQWKVLNIGDANGAAIDLVTSSGSSLYGNGAAVPTRHLRQHQSIDHFASDFNSILPIYLLSYTSSINGALAGRVSGGYKFEGTRGDQIQLSLPSPPISEIQTITCSSAPSAGVYRFQYDNETSAPIAFNASAATMKSTIEAMRNFAARFITVTVSAAASAGASFTVTFVDPQGALDGDLLTIVGDGLGVTASTGRTTAAVPGLASGQYDITVYSYIYNVCGYANNKLHAQLLLA